MFSDTEVVLYLFGITLVDGVITITLVSSEVTASLVKVFSGLVAEWDIVIEV
jgi:hypothetical protein